jgi:hypothetical protein
VARQLLRPGGASQSSISYGDRVLEKLDHTTPVRAVRVYEWRPALMAMVRVL